MKFISNSPKQTKEFAKKVASLCFGNEVILLSGDLGVGKTTFTKGFAEGLGITATITSPTFTLMKTYRGGRLTLYHFDLYRADNEEDVEELGFEDYFDGGGVCVIEWNKFSTFPGKVIKINFTYGEGDVREIETEGLDESSLR